MYATLSDNAARLRPGTLVVCNHFSNMDPLVLNFRCALSAKSQ